MLTDYFNKEICVTKINRVAFVDKNEYSDKKLYLMPKLFGNELIFHFSGHAKVLFNDNVLETKENTIRFLPEGTAKRYIVDRIDFESCILISFKTKEPISQEAFVLDAGNNKKLPALFKKAFSVWIKKEKGYYFECISILYKIMSELQKDMYAPPKKYTLIKPALDYILNNFCKNEIKIEDLADLCGISYSYFRRLFIEYMGIPPKKYIIGLKIDKACALITEKKMSMAQIAEECGFGENHFFSRQFKEYTAMSPSEYQIKYKSSK